MGRDEKELKKTGKQDNRGFSLLELLVSIIILVLIMIPLMNNFFNSMRVTNVAEGIQDNSNLASNIMEGLKSLDIQKTLVQFKGDITNFDHFDIITNSDGTANAQGKQRLQKNGDGTYSAYAGAEDAQDVNYFGIDGILENGSLYDALITVDAKVYTPTDPSDTTMNNFLIPNISQIDEDKNGMFLFKQYMDKITGAFGIRDDGMNDESLDNIAIAHFVDEANKYADQQFKQNSTVYAGYLAQKSNWIKKCQEEEGYDEPQPTEPTRASDSAYANPDYCQSVNITKWITKTAELMIDSVTESGVDKSFVTYRMKYNCSWPEDVKISDSSFVKKISTKKYSTLLKNYYFYYDVTDFQKEDTTISNRHPDIIQVSNKTGRMIYFYLVKQENIFEPSVTLYCDDGDNVNDGTEFITIFTNMDLPTEEEDVGVFIPPGTIDGDKKNPNVITTSELKQRIFSITVQVYPYEESMEDKYQNCLYTLQSSREE